MIIMGIIEVNYLGKKQRVIKMAKEVSRINAIKLYRELYHSTIREAKETVCKWLEDAPR
jgi:ribosomal protein L7/L12